MDPNKPIISLSWDQVHQDARTLARMLFQDRRLCHIKTLVAVTRGGLIPTAILARELNIRLIDTLCLASYDEFKGEVNFIEPLSQKTMRIVNESIGEDFLIIDDLVDTGETAKFIKYMFPKAIIATLYAKPLGLPFADFFVRTYAQSVWIQFPWDCSLQFQWPIIEEEKNGG